MSSTRQKYLFLTGILVTVTILAGCGQRAKTEEKSTEAEQALEESGATTAQDRTTSEEGQLQGQVQSSSGSETIDVAQMQSAISQASQQPQEVSSNLSTSEKPTIEQIQQALQNAGFYQGKIDGDLGPRTKKAILDFQQQNALTVDGKVGPQTWSKLFSYLNKAFQSTASSSSEITN